MHANFIIDILSTQWKAHFNTYIFENVIGYVWRTKHFGSFEDRHFACFFNITTCKQIRKISRFEFCNIHFFHDFCTSQFPFQRTNYSFTWNLSMQFPVCVFLYYFFFAYCYFNLENCVYTSYEIFHPTSVCCSRKHCNILWYFAHKFLHA